MSALRERKKFKCKEHEDELLKYVCQDCRYTLVCSIGKNTRHKGHTLLDIKTAGVQIRQWFWEEIRVTNDCIRDTARALSKKRSFKTNGDGSVQATLCDLQTNVQELKRKLDVFLQTQKGYAEQFAKIHSDEELPEDIETLEETLHSLQKYKRQMTKFSGESVPYVKLIQQFCMLEKSHNCRDEARERLSRMSRFNTLVFLLVPSDESPLEGSSERPHRQAHHPSNQSSDHWETFTRKMIGFPKMAQTADQNLTTGVGESKESFSSDMAMVHMLSLELGDIVPILALHIADEDRIFVAHWGQLSGPPLPVIPGGKMPTTSEDIIICFLNNNGTKLVPDRVFGGDGVVQPVITTTLPDKRVRLFCTQNGASVKQDVFDLGTLFPRDQVHQEFFCAVKPSSSKRQPFPGRSQSYEVHKISHNTEEADELLFTVQLEDTPLRVVANRNLEAFAIIIQQNSGSKKKKKTTVECPPEPQLYVRVYTKKDKDSAMPPEFRGVFGKEELKKAMVFGKGAGDFRISDVCFYQKSNTTSPSQNGDIASQSGSRSNENGEMLIIATVTALIVLDYENACAVLDFFFLGYSLPDRRALFPTALTTDKDGQLWIGCRGGKVLCWKHIEDVMQSTYMEPATLGAAYDVDEDWPEGEFDDDDEDDDEGETSSIGSFTSDDRSLLGRARPHSDSIESGILETGEAPADYYYVNAEDSIYELNFPPPRPPPPRPPRRPISNSSDSSSSTANSDPASLPRQHPEQTTAKPYLRPNKEPWNPPNVASPTSILPRQKQMTLQDELKLKVKQKQHQQQSRQLAEETQQSTREPFPSPKPERQLKTQHQEQQAPAQQPVQQQQPPVQQQPQQPPVKQQQLSQQQQPPVQQQQQASQPQQQQASQPQQQDQQLQHLFHQQQQQLIWLQQQVQQMQQQQPQQQQLQPLHHHQQQQQPSLSPQTAPPTRCSTPIQSCYRPSSSSITQSSTRSPTSPSSSQNSPKARQRSESCYFCQTFHFAESYFAWSHFV